MISGTRADPTRTTVLRNQFVAEMKARFRKIKKAVVSLIVDEDAFGLKPTPNPLTRNELTANTRFRFLTTAKKIKAFQEWFKEQVNEGLLEIEDGVDPDKPWLSKYTTSAYKRGILRSYVDAAKELLTEQSDIFNGTKSAFLESAFAGPIGVKQVELLSTRAFEQLKGISNDMSGQLSRTLSDGFVNGHGPRKIAREITKTIDGIEKKRALTLARTEIIHSYAEGQLDSLEQFGVEDVAVMAEWSTAGDDLVCPLCLPLVNTVWKIKEARGMIPRHPNCRCAWIPDIENKRNAKKNRKAIFASTRAERPKVKTNKEAVNASRWAGADVV